MFSYSCPQCGLVDFPEPHDQIACRCGRAAKRRYQVQINRSSLKSEARWDPVVGAHVSSDREFRSLLAQGQDAQSERLGMDVKLATCDARDREALGELHGYSADQRTADLEGTRKAEWERSKV